MNKIEKTIVERGWKILDKRIVEKNDPVAPLFGHEGRIEEWTVRKSDGSVVTTRIAMWDVPNDENLIEDEKEQPKRLLEIDDEENSLSSFPSFLEFYSNWKSSKHKMLNDDLAIHAKDIFEC